MRDELKGKAKSNECLILNMDDSNGNGTHWTCLFVNKNRSYYFDSFGLPPPLEIVNYCSNGDRLYSTFKIQKPHEVICGHYSIYVLYKLSHNFAFEDVLFEFINEHSE